jgi:pimeloyl-ACP methyl ester carboxylesterase
MGFQEKHLNINGVDTAVFTAGEGKPVVFFHGGGTATGFDCLLPIAARNKLILAHHPGFGSSGDPAAASFADLAKHHLAVLDKLGVGEFSLIGHSMGGWTAATVAHDEPSRVSKLVLAAPAGNPSTAHPIVDIMKIPPDQLLSYLAADMSVFGPMDGPPPPDFIAAREREGGSFAKIMAKGLSDPKLPNWVPKIKAPTLIVWGDADRIIPIGQAAEWQALLPKATVKKFPGVGHLLFDESAAVVAAVADFVAG